MAAPMKAPHQMRPGNRYARETSASRTLGEKVRAALMIDRAGKRIRQRRHEREDLDVDVWARLLDRAFPLPVDAGEGEQRTLLLGLQGKPVPARGLTLVRLTEGRCRHQAAP